MSIVGLGFTYVDGLVDEIKGTGNPANGPIVPIVIDVRPGEFIAGATVEACPAVPRKIGFTLLRA